MILTFHSTLSAEDIEKERLANRKALKEIFSNPRKAWKFLREAGVEIPDRKNGKHSPGKTPRVAIAR